MKRFMSSVAVAVLTLACVAAFGVTAASAAQTTPTIVLTSTTGAVYGVSNGVVTATTSVAGTVDFMIGTTTVTGCGAAATTTVSPFTAICSWAATANGPVTFNATFTPTDATDYSTATAKPLVVTVVAPMEAGNQFLSFTVDTVVGFGSAKGSTTSGGCGLENSFGQGATVVFRMWGIDNMTGTPLLANNVQSVVIQDLPGVTTAPAMSYSPNDGYWTYGWFTTSTTPTGVVPYQVVVTLNPVNPVYKTVTKAEIKYHFVKVAGKRVKLPYVVHVSVKVLVSATMPAESYTFTDSGLASESQLTITAVS